MTTKNMAWLDYAVRDDRGSICGLQKDAPEEIKRAYEEFKQTYEKYKQKTI